MHSGPGRRFRRTVGLGLAAALCFALGLGLAVVASFSLTPAAGATTHHEKTRQPTKNHPDLAKTSSVTLGDCTAEDVVMRARVPRLTYTATQPVTVVVVVHNVSSQTCTYGGTGGRYPEYLGPCGALSLQVEGRGGAPLWPGPVAYSCPSIGPTTLAPGAAFTATGTWPRAIVTRSSSRGAPAGTYRLVIDGVITFIIRLR
jgi:hypothetical protein